MDVFYYIASFTSALNFSSNHMLENGCETAMQTEMLSHLNTQTTVAQTTSGGNAVHNIQSRLTGDIWTESPAEALWTQFVLPVVNQ